MIGKVDLGKINGVAAKGKCRTLTGMYKGVKGGCCLRTRSLTLRPACYLLENANKWDGIV